MKPLQILNQMSLEEYKRKYPEIPYPSTKKFKQSSANEITKAVIKFLKLSGWQAERINTMGRVIDQRQTYTDVLGHLKQIGTMKYIPSTSTRGSSDISATIRGRSIKIEVKAGRDVQSLAQKEYQKAIERAGGIYIICHSFDEFYQWYQEFISSQ